MNQARRRPCAPFGGYKQSGLGREHGEYGLEEFLEVKAFIEQSSRTGSPEREAG